MKKLSVLAILCLFSGLSLSQTNKPSFAPCLQDPKDRSNIYTVKRLAVVSNHKYGNIIINLYGIPIWEGVEPNTEGCERLDGAILIYDEETQKPLFHKSGNINQIKIIIDEEVIKPYEDIFTQSNDTDLLIRHHYMGNCGGCYNLLFFKRLPEFTYFGSLYVGPERYGTKYIEYDSFNNKIYEQVISGNTR